MLEWTALIFTKIKNTMKRVRVIKGWTVFGEKMTVRQTDVFASFRDSVRLLVRASVSFESKYELIQLSTIRY